MSSFRGTEIGIDGVEIEGDTDNIRIRFSVQFMDQDGLVHATTVHELRVSAEDTGNKKAVAESSSELIRNLIRWCKDAHFDTDYELDNPVPNTEENNGIAESLRIISDEPGESA